MKRVIWGCLGACVILTAGCASVGHEPAGGTSPAQGGNGTDTALRRAITELVAMPGGPPGVAVVVQRNGNREFFAGGVSEIGGRVPRIDDHMRAASVTKAFTAATALVLVDKGLLSLDDTVGRRLPQSPARWHDITVRELMAHTSGLPDYIHTDAFVKDFTASPDRAPSPQTLLGYIRNEPLAFRPGTEYAYSNSDNIAVGPIIQAVTKQPFEQVLQQRVLNPLGLHGTSLPADDSISAPFMHGYDIAPKTGQLEDITRGIASGWAWASGGIVSTPADFNTFIRGYVSGRLISNKTRTAWLQPFLPDSASDPNGPGFNSAGLSLFRYDARCGTVYGHTGNIFGYTQFAVSTLDGSRSATVSINLQRTQDNEGQPARVFAGLIQVVQAAVCRALA
jgi:D-alanyl-D-alanine carboxypeptidase